MLFQPQYLGFSNFPLLFNGFELVWRCPYSVQVTDWKVRVRISAQQQIFFPPDSIDCLWDPSTVMLNGHHDSFLVVKRPERDVDHSSPSRAKVKNKWSYTSTPRDKWVPVTTAWRVLRLRMEERPPIRRVAANIQNKQQRRADKGWSSSLEVGRGVDNSSP